MSVYAFLSCFIPFMASQSHDDFYYEVCREREVTKYILTERLHVVDKNIDKIEEHLNSADCPLYLYAMRVCLLHDKEMIKKMIISLKRN